MGTTIHNQDLLAPQDNNGQGPGAIEQKLRAKEAARLTYFFTIPAVYAGEADGILKFGMVKLRPDEELAATDAAQSNVIRLGYELAKSSLRVVVTEKGEQQVYSHDGSADRVLAKMDPVIRTLVISAYGRLHNPKKEVMEVFLDRFETRG